MEPIFLVGEVWKFELPFRVLKEEVAINRRADEEWILCRLYVLFAGIAFTLLCMKFMCSYVKMTGWRPMLTILHGAAQHFVA